LDKLTAVSAIYRQKLQRKHYTLGLYFPIGLLTRFQLKSVVVVLFVDRSLTTMTGDISSLADVDLNTVPLAQSTKSVEGRLWVTLKLLAGTEANIHLFGTLKKKKDWLPMMWDTLSANKPSTRKLTRVWILI